MPQPASAPAFAARLAAVAQATQAMLDGLLQPEALPGEVFRPQNLLDAMRYACLDGGKRLRPFLLVETAALFGVDNPGVLRAAAALEVLHCYSLVHDDLPAMDDDDLRRGRPTTHRAFDEATAILAGDSLLTLAFDVMADPQTHPSPDIRIKLVRGLAQAAGLGGMAGGQALDLAAETAAAPLSASAIMQLQIMKTGALILYAVEAGALIGGADAGQQAHLRDYATALGAAFQIADDLLDAQGDAARLGKATGKDAAANKATLVQALGLAAARARLDALVEQARTALQHAGFGPRAHVLDHAARFVASRDA